MRIPEQLPSRPQRSDQPTYTVAMSIAGVMQQADWLRCSACCAGKAGFGACLARCMATGQACDGGVDNCSSC